MARICQEFAVFHVMKYLPRKSIIMAWLSFSHSSFFFGRVFPQKMLISIDATIQIGNDYVLLERMCVLKNITLLFTGF